MSETAARAALERMNCREVMIAGHYTGVAKDLAMMAAADPAEQERLFMERRRSELCAAYGFPSATQDKPFAFAGGIAIIPITGILINRFGQSYSWVTGYNFIRRQVALAEADEDVLGILYDVMSFGGEVGGCFETARIIRESAGRKPSMAFIDAHAYSAGYALACSAGRVVSTESGGAASIGVVAMHISYEKMIKDIGWEVSLIHSGDHKVDGNPFQKLPASVRADIQKGCDRTRAEFVALVAEHRGLDPKVVYDTEARTYRAEDALALGLIDAIESPTAAVQAFLAELSGSKTTSKENAMTIPTTEPGAANTAAPDAAAAAAAQASAVASAATAARQAERARVQGILGCPEAANRQGLANHLAMKTDMSVDDAKAMLSASAEEKPAAAAPAAAVKNPFEAAMNATPNPNVGADAGQSADAENSPEAAVARILAAQSLATGVKLEPAKSN